LKEITGHNLIGELSELLFGTMDEDDAKYYNEQIKLFEQNSEDINILLKQQLSVVRSSLGAVNNTLADAEYNENFKVYSHQLMHFLI
jgi:hypothetical protein